MCFVYGKLKKDFRFLEDYGFEYVEKYRHNIIPCVIFSDKKIKIQLGIDYESHRIYVLIYNPRCHDLLESEKELKKLPYKKQLVVVSEKLKEYLMDRQANF